MEEDEERMKPYLTNEALKAGCMLCRNVSTGEKHLQLADRGMEETHASDDLKFVGYEVGNTVAEMLSNGRKKSSDSTYEHGLF